MSEIQLFEYRRNIQVIAWQLISVICDKYTAGKIQARNKLLKRAKLFHFDIIIFDMSRGSSYDTHDFSVMYLAISGNSMRIYFNYLYYIILYDVCICINKYVIINYEEVTINVKKK